MARKTKQSDTPAEGAEKIGFEDAVEQLEEIIDRIESGEAGLERSIREYERGMELIRRCRTILDQAEQRVAELSAAGDATEQTTGDADDAS